MINFSQYIVEGRSHPENNPKESATDLLRKYKDNPNIYITFTEIEKVGVNPHTKFETPAGIYTYPLKEFWTFYNVEKEGSVSKAAPYAGNAPNIYVLEGKNTPGFLYEMTKYSKSQFKKDCIKIKKMLSTIKLVGIDPNREYDRVYEDAIITSYNKTPISKFWNFTRLLSSDEITMRLLNFNNKSPFNWNNLLRRLGYTGFGDRKGVGIIHGNEPLQAVFLTISEFKVVDKVINKEYKNSVDLSHLDWNGGTWENKVWLWGTWKDGIWKSGTWNDGEWLGGAWLSGEWKNGTWHKGKWNNGEWLSGIWKNGTWNDGIWKNGTWEDGTWKDGEWYYGDWNKGTWEDGIWNLGIWHLGNWKDGEWKNGIWKAGVWQNGIWENGVWQNGLWMNGTFSGGNWNDGKWQNGTWIKGFWKVGKIFSKKFGKYVLSRVNPLKFYKIEQESKSLSDLEKEVYTNARIPRI